MSNLPPSTTAESTTIPDPHYLVDRLLKLESGSGASQFYGGLQTQFSSVKFLFKHRELWPHVAIPALINITMFFVTAAFLLWNHDWFVLPEPIHDGFTYYILIVLWWLYKILLYPLLVALAYFLTMILAGVVASPFNETLSERAEELMMGRAVPAETGWKAILVGGARGVATAAATAIPRAIIVITLSIIPGIGPILAAFVGAYFIAVGYSDYAFERRKYSIRRKLGTIWKHRRMALGFGVGANLMLIVPIVNFLCMPVAVVGGTALAIALDEFESRPPDSPDDH